MLELARHDGLLLLDRDVEHAVRDVEVLRVAGGEGHHDLGDLVRHVALGAVTCDGLERHRGGVLRRDLEGSPNLRGHVLLLPATLVAVLVVCELSTFGALQWDLGHRVRLALRARDLAVLVLDAVVQLLEARRDAGRADFENHIGLGVVHEPSRADHSFSKTRFNCSTPAAGELAVSNEHTTAAPSRELISTGATACRFWLMAAPPTSSESASSAPCSACVVPSAFTNAASPTSRSDVAVPMGHCSRLRSGRMRRRPAGSMPTLMSPAAAEVKPAAVMATWHTISNKGFWRSLPNAPGRFTPEIAMSSSLRGD